MKLLIDESLPRPLKRHFAGHVASTVVDCGWASKSNGALLSLAEAEFDVLVTADQNIEHQQDAGQYDIAIVVPRARSTRLTDLLPLVPKALDEISRAEVGSVVIVVR